MFERAKKERDGRIVRLYDFEKDGFVKALDKRNMILAPWCERVACEKDVKDRSAKM
jgi:prolyl-tRNA synthetase